MADPEHEEHENMLRWRGPFDPESFSLAAANPPLQRENPLGSKDSGIAPYVSTEAPRWNGSSAGFGVAGAVLVEWIWDTTEGSKADSTWRKALSGAERPRADSEAHLRRRGVNGRLRIVRTATEPPIYRFTPDDIDELAIYVAAEANHGKHQ